MDDPSELKLRLYENSRTTVVSELVGSAAVYEVASPKFLNTRGVNYLNLLGNTWVSKKASSKSFGYAGIQLHFTKVMLR